MILLRYENMRKEELEVIGSAWDILGHAGVAYLLEDLGAFATVSQSTTRLRSGSYSSLLPTKRQPRCRARQLETLIGAQCNIIKLITEVREPSQGRARVRVRATSWMRWCRSCLVLIAPHTIEVSNPKIEP
jgi:hypothetical protein